MRLRHSVTGTQVLVPNDKAQRLIAHDGYEPVPDDEQPPPGVGERVQRNEDERGHTSIAASLIAAAEPHLRAEAYGYE